MTAEIRHVSLKIVHADGWAVTEEPLAGSREKNTVISPENKHFVFKQPKERRPAQIWSEMVASFIAGDMLNWPVQTSAIASRAGQIGTLHEYIYDPSVEGMTAGYQFCAECEPEFDFDKGTKHTIPLLERLVMHGMQPLLGVPSAEYFQYWGRALAFDTLISNVDRHAENWGVIQSAGGSRMAPLYDNGSSLGCGIEAQGLARWFDSDGKIKPDRMSGFDANGRHHVRADEPANKGGLFNDVNARFLANHAEQEVSFVQCADLELGPVEAFLRKLLDVEGLPDSYMMTTERMEHIVSVLHCGRDRVRRLLHRERIR